MLFLKSLGTRDHFLILHPLELEVDALHDHLVLFANDLQHLALTLLVATADHFDLSERETRLPKLTQTL